MVLHLAINKSVLTIYHGNLSTVSRLVNLTGRMHRSNIYLKARGQSLINLY